MRKSKKELSEHVIAKLKLIAVLFDDPPRALEILIKCTKTMNTINGEVVKIQAMWKNSVMEDYDTFLQTNFRMYQRRVERKKNHPLYILEDQLTRGSAPQPVSCHPGMPQNLDTIEARRPKGKAAQSRYGKWQNPNRE